MNHPLPTVTQSSSQRDLDEVVRFYREHLPPGQLQAFRIDGLDHLGVPVAIASFTDAADGSTVDGYGYGTTEAEAMVGAFGELSETVHCRHALQNRQPTVETYSQLREKLGPSAVVDPLSLCLPAGSFYTPEVPLQWTTVTRWPSGEPVMAPWEFVAISSSQWRPLPQVASPLTVPITNGLGAGRDLAQALGHGLLELLQRDGNCLTYRALDQGIVIAPDEIADPGLAALWNHYRECGLEVLPKLATTEFDLVNVFVVGREHQLQRAEHPLMLSGCGEAVHPSRELAFRKALLEYASSRARKAFKNGPLSGAARVSPPGYLDNYLASLNLDQEEPRRLNAMIAWCRMNHQTLMNTIEEPIFSHRRQVPLSSLPHVPHDEIATPQARFELTAERLVQAGFDILYADFSPPDKPLSIVKAIVPGLECETMSYYRLGERGLGKLLARGDEFVGGGSPPAGTLPVRLTAEAEGRLGGPAWLDPQKVDAIVGPLYALYREPVSHAAPAAIEQAAARRER